MANFFSDLYAPRGSATQVVTTGVLPNRRFKAAPGISRVPMHSTRGYFDFRSSSNPVLTTGDELRLMKMRSGDRIYELNLWVSNTGYGDWAGSLVMDFGLAEQGPKHDGPVLERSFFASDIDIVGGAPHNRTDLLVEANVLQTGYRGWLLWEIMADTIIAFQDDVNDPVTNFDLVATVDSGTPTGTQGSILVEMIFQPAGT